MNTFKSLDPSTPSVDWTYKSDYQVPPPASLGQCGEQLHHSDNGISYLTDKTGQEVYLILKGERPQKVHADLLEMAIQLEMTVLHERANRFPGVV